MRCLLGQAHRDTILRCLPVEGGGRMLEWGSGGSTLWFADRLPPGATLTSVDHDPDWHSQVAAAIGRRDNTRLLFCPPDGPLGANATIAEEDPRPLQQYINAPDAAPTGFDVILIDGVARAACLERARTILKPGGTIFLHDAQRPWYDAAKSTLIAHGTIGSCPEYPSGLLWWGSTSAPQPQGSRAALPPVICFYTRNTAYEDEARRLIESCKRLGLQHEVSPIDPAPGGSWEQTCARKARYVLDRYLALDRAVLWVDADAVIHALPMLLAGTDADFAVCRAGGWEFNSATVFFNRTELGELLLRTWVRHCEADPRTWDQIHLDSAWEEVTARRPLRTLWLPQSYARIFDAPPEGPAHEPAVIEQFQASRRLKSAVSRAPALVPTEAPPDLHAARRAGRPRACFYDDRFVLRAETPAPARRCIEPGSATTARPSIPTRPALTPAASLDRRARETARLLASSLVRLNFGCGDHPIPGWTNIDNGDGEWYSAPGHPDVIALDIFEALDALPDACASFIYSEHVFEHFTLQQGHDILRDWFRILKPRGTVRIVCPDLEAEARLFLRQIAPADDASIDAHRVRWLDGRNPLQEGENLTRAMVLNASMRLDGHKFVYDQETLAQLLRLAGFDSITRERFGHSTHAPLSGIDTHDGGDTGRSWVPSVALVMEATRPEGVAAPPRAKRRDATAALPSDHHHLLATISTLRARCDQLAAAADRARYEPVIAAAVRCSAAGYRRIALYGAGRHTLPISRQPWQSHDIRVTAILDDDPKVPSIRAVPVLRPDQLDPGTIDAVVISSDVHEPAIYRRALAIFEPRHIPVLRVYAEANAWHDADATRVRLIERWGLSSADARWLVDNRSERHDATLPMLPPERTELHLRRYEFAAAHASGKRVLDAACGTGYGSALLRTQGGAASVTGIDIDPRAVDYALRRHGGPGITFRAASAAQTGLGASSIDLAVSFETIEHAPDPAALLDEFARVLIPRGTLILSTPNDAGLTQHHVHSFTPASIAALLDQRFTELRWFAQRADASPTIAPPAAGITPLRDDAPPSETLIIVARRRD